MFRNIQLVVRKNNHFLSFHSYHTFCFCYGLDDDKFAINLRLAVDAGANVFYC